MLGSGGGLKCFRKVREPSFGGVSGVPGRIWVRWFRGTNLKGKILRYRSGGFCVFVFKGMLIQENVLLSTLDLLVVVYRNTDTMHRSHCHCPAAALTTHTTARTNFQFSKFPLSQCPFSRTCLPTTSTPPASPPANNPNNFPPL
jgi:hypothetical protein